MSSIFQQDQIKPFISVLIILLSLFLLAFFEITARRLSYSLYQENRKFDRVQEKYYIHLQDYASKISSDRLESLAKNRQLDEKKRGQIIQVIDGKALVIQ